MRTEFLARYGYSPPRSASGSSIPGVVPSRFLLFDVVDQLFERRDKGLRLSQGVLRQLEFRDQHASFVDNDQPIALIHRHALV